MNILIAPDKFKVSLTAVEVCNAVEEGILKYNPEANITKLPLADGGEGSLLALENSINFKRIYFDMKNPLFKTIKSYYGLLNNAAYIEMASTSGLQLLDEDERSATLTTSFGTGEMVLDAFNKGAKKIYLFIGGSATNDAGIGMATALGYMFIDSNGKELIPIGANLRRIKKIDSTNAISFEGVEFNVLTDVNNPLFGKNGAAHVFAKQKGANENEIKLLDEGLKNISQIWESSFGIDISNLKGGGAAGGLGAGTVAFCNAKLKSGIQSILDLLNFDKLLKETNLVITGEGLLDQQTLEGKVVKGVMDRCKEANLPLGILCGDLALSEVELKEIHALAIKAIKREGISIEQSMNNAYSYLVERSEELIKELDS